MQVFKPLKRVFLSQQNSFLSCKLSGLKSLKQLKNGEGVRCLIVLIYLHALNKFCKMRIEIVHQTHKSQILYLLTIYRQQSAAQTPKVKVQSPVSNPHAENYNMDFPNRGHALILNHMNFDCLADRAGSDKDCTRLKETLTALGFEVQVHHDLKRNGVYEMLEKCKLFLI
jgi:hypothetical protein